MKLMRTILAVLMVTLATMTGQTQDEVLRTAEIPAQFPGGDAALLKYINRHMVIPDECRQAVGAVCLLQFVVTKTGEVGEVKVLRSSVPQLDSIAVNTVKHLPRFTPARQNGKPVNIWYTLPIRIRQQY